jgi:hypothetical protein
MTSTVSAHPGGRLATQRVVGHENGVGHHRRLLESDPGRDGYQLPRGNEEVLGEASWFLEPHPPQSRAEVLAARAAGGAVTAADVEVDDDAVAGRQVGDRAPHLDHLARHLVSGHVG